MSDDKLLLAVNFAATCEWGGYYELKDVPQETLWITLIAMSDHKQEPHLSDIEWAELFKDCA